MEGDRVHAIGTDEQELRARSPVDVGDVEDRGVLRRLEGEIGLSVEVPPQVPEDRHGPGLVGAAPEL